MTAMRTQAPTPAGTPRARDERGAAAVEFALVLPVLLALLLGIISFGYMLSFRQSVSLSAAEGARAAAVAPTSLTDADRVGRARDAVNAALGHGVTCDGAGGLRRGGAAAGSCTITIDTTCGVHGCARVNLAYDYAANPLIPSFPGLGLVLPTTLAYEAVAEVSR